MLASNMMRMKINVSVIYLVFISSCLAVEPQGKKIIKSLPGFAVRLGLFPALISICKQEHACLGVILDEMHVLTTARCCLQSSHLSVVPLTNVTPPTSDDAAQYAESVNPRCAVFENPIQPPKYDSDIGVLRLEKPISIRNCRKFRPIQLPKNPIDRNLGSLALKAIGYGYIPLQNRTNIKNKKVLIAAPVYKKPCRLDRIEDYICLSGFEKTLFDGTSFTADYGTPVITDENDGSQTIRALLSYITHDGHMVFTDVYKYKDFIEKVLSRPRSDDLGPGPFVDVIHPPI